MLIISRRRAQRPTRLMRSEDSGFTLVELLVSLLILGAVLLGLMAVQVKALQGVSLAKQRQQATALANQTMEQLRAQPYDSVTAGLLATDATTADPNIALIGGVKTFRPAYDTAISETLLTTTSSVATPLNPHIQQVRVENVAYAVRTYVSRADPTQNLGYWLTVVVSWSSGSSGGVTKTTAARSRLFSPTGCNASSTATRPFAGPCQAFFYTDAGSSAAGISVSPVTAGQQLLAGVDAVSMEVSTPGLSVRTQNEQIVSTQSSSSTSSGSITTSTSTIAAGGQTAVSAADTDPATGQGSAPTTPSTVSYSGTNPTSSGASGSFTATLPAANGSTFSTTGAATSPACPDTTGASLMTGQACSASDITPSGAYEASMQLTLPGHGPMSFSLSRINSLASPTPWRAYGARAVAATPGRCTTIVAGQPGCVASGVTRDVGQVVAGTFAVATSGDSLPAGFTSMARLSGFAARANAEAGTGITTPTASRTAMLSYWNGSVMTTPAAIPASGGSWNLGTATATYSLGGVPALVVSMTGTVVADPVVTSGTVPCPAAGCTVDALVGSVRVSVTYTVVHSGVTIGTFNVDTDLGSTLAQSTYKAAPSA